MQRKTIFIILIVAVLTFSILSLYTSFAYNEENNDLGESNANYNLVYSLKEENGKQLTVQSKSDIYVDLEITNIYDYAVKYGAYYYLVNPKTVANGLTVSRIDDGAAQDIIEAHESKTISLRIANETDYSIDLIVGTLVGFENGNVEDLVTNGLVLVK